MASDGAVFEAVGSRPVTITKFVRNSNGIRDNCRSAQIVTAVLHGELKAKRGVSHRSFIGAEAAAGYREPLNMQWLSTPELGLLAGISRQKAHSALAKALRGESRCGVLPEVRSVRGRGGRSGVGYEARLDTLPGEVQHRHQEVYGPLVPQLPHGPAAQADRDFWYHVISPALAHPKGSRERGDAEKVILMRQWDRAVSFDDAEKHRIARDIRQFVRALHTKGIAPARLRA